MSETRPEVWLRGAVDGYDPLVMPMVHALLQVREDLEVLGSGVPPDHVWHRPGGAASIGYHVRHLGGALDRLFTYARGEALSDEQRASLRRESESGDPLTTVIAETTALIDKALAQLRTTTAEQLLTPRAVGRAQLPSTMLGLLAHAADHSTRHAGQALTTAKILAAAPA